MHANAVLLQKLFTGLNQHNDQVMTECYHAQAAFRDIAFDLRGKEQIHAMWQMICEGRSNIRATFEVVHADDQSGQVSLVDNYTFYASDDSPPSSGREVRNVIDSRFRFRDGFIIEHHDLCDARAWGRMALGGVAGFLAGRLRFLRSRKARQMLDRFLAKRAKEDRRV
jgi:hypothetical protein